MELVAWIDFVSICTWPQPSNVYSGDSGGPLMPIYPDEAVGDFEGLLNRWTRTRRRWYEVGVASVATKHGPAGEWIHLNAFYFSYSS